MNAVLTRVMIAIAMVILSAGAARRLEAQACAICNYNGGPDSH